CTSQQQCAWGGIGKLIPNKDSMPCATPLEEAVHEISRVANGTRLPVRQIGHMHLSSSAEATNQITPSVQRIRQPPRCRKKNPPRP
nr:hypothetical protein [Tanacetum cinerariifolium]